MDTKNLITLKTILETGSFQKAADKLNFTQSTVTFQIRRLEEELNLQLFEKIGRKMVLTQAGKEIMPEIDAILEGVERVNNYGKEIAEITGTLKLAIPDSILIYTMQPFLIEFMHRAPKVRLMVNSIPSGEINQVVMDGSVDLAINCEKYSYPNSVVHKKLGNYKVFLVASPFANTNELDFISSNQTKAISLICNEPDGYYQIDFNNYLKSKDIEMNPYMKVQSIEAVKKCVMSNLGVAVVPSYSVEEELKSGARITVRTELDEKEYNSIYLYNKNKWISPQMELALELLEKHSN